MSVSYAREAASPARRSCGNWKSGTPPVCSRRDCAGGGPHVFSPAAANSIAGIQDFIEASISAGMAGRRRRRVLIGVASVATVAALVFAGLADYARRVSVRAQSDFEAATTALSTLIESVPEKVEPVAPLQTVATLMDEARKAIAKFPPTEGASPQIRRYRAEISLALAVIEFDLGKFQDARGSRSRSGNNAGRRRCKRPCRYRNQILSCANLASIGSDLLSAPRRCRRGAGRV